MVIIGHKGGWTCSNESWLEEKKRPIITNGKTTGFDKTTYCILTNPYTVSGEYSGEVKIAIKDDTTDEVKCFLGAVETPVKIKITHHTGSEWLKSLK